MREPHERGSFLFLMETLLHAQGEVHWTDELALVTVQSTSPSVQCAQQQGETIQSIMRVVSKNFLL